MLSPLSLKTEDRPSRACISLAMGRATLPLFVMVTRVAAVLVAAIVCTRVFGLGEHAVFVSIALGNVAGAVVLIALFVATQRRARAVATTTTTA